VDFFDVRRTDAQPEDRSAAHELQSASSTRRAWRVIYEDRLLHGRLGGGNSFRVSVAGPTIWHACRALGGYTYTLQFD
jgi:hypothetical protein